MIEALFGLFIVFAVLGFCWWVMQFLKMPEPMRQILIGLGALILVIYVISVAASLLGVAPFRFRHLP